MVIVTRVKYFHVKSFKYILVYYGMLKLQFNDDLTLTEQQIVLTLTTPKATVYFPVRYVFFKFFQYIFVQAIAS